MWLRIGFALALLPGVAVAESVVALRTIPAKSVVSGADIGLVAAEIDGALTDVGAALGLEAKATIYAGRPVRSADLVSPTLVERNQTVRLVYRTGSLTITAEGRALARGAEGDVIRVMNLSSKATVSGKVSLDGSITVGDWN